MSSEPPTTGNTSSHTSSGQGAGAVGFVGLGNMGRPMAANLRRGGFRVLVHDVRPAIATAFASEHGGVVVAPRMSFLLRE